MDDWQEQLWKQVEKAATDMEELFVDVEKATETVVEEVGESIGSFLEQFGFNLVEEVDSFIENIVEIIVTTSDEIDAAFGEDFDRSVDDFVDDFYTNNDYSNVGFHSPSAENNPACINCINYHGQSYNGILLVCGMHPQGWDDDSCPDWEAEN